MKKYETTKKEMFATVIAIVEGSDASNKEELIERLNHEIELVSKSRTTGEKAQAKAENDKLLTDLIIAVLAENTMLTVSEIQAKEPKLSITKGINTSKVTALLTKAVNAGIVERVKDKKKTYYGLPAPTVTES